MSDFQFKVGNAFQPMLAFRVGFSAEVETVNGWTTGGFMSINPVFITIPSGPVLIKSVGQSIAGSTFQIAESESPALLAQWIVDNGFVGTTGITVRDIPVPAGAVFTAYQNVSGPFIGMRVSMGSDNFSVEAMGIPERAPASMLQDPNPSQIIAGV